MLKYSWLSITRKLEYTLALQRDVNKMRTQFPFLNCKWKQIDWMQDNDCKFICHFWQLILQIKRFSSTIKEIIWPKSLSGIQSPYDRYLALIWKLIGLRQKPDVQRKNDNNFRFQNLLMKHLKLKLTNSCNIWDKVLKSGPSKICGRQSLKNLKGYGLLKQTISLQIF